MWGGLGDSGPGVGATGAGIGSRAVVGDEVEPGWTGARVSINGAGVAGAGVGSRAVVGAGVVRQPQVVSTVSKSVNSFSESSQTHSVTSVG